MYRGLKARSKHVALAVFRTKVDLVHEAVDQLEKALCRNRRLVLVVWPCAIQKLSADDFAIDLYQGRDVTGHN